LSLGLVVPLEIYANGPVTGITCHPERAALNLRFNQADIETTLNSLADDVLPDFSG